LGREGKVYGVASTLGINPLSSWPVGEAPLRGTVALSCGTSEASGLPDKCVDLVVTDPPFFDNVHYSELADFFFAWQSLEPRGFIQPSTFGALGTTRSKEEVQDGNAGRFAAKLQRVLAECHRVLKDEGLLVFTYHHSRTDGWVALAEAVYNAGFSIERAHPVRSEMAGATPKNKARSPILMDAVLVCSKREHDLRSPRSADEAVAIAIAEVREQLSRLASVGQRATPGDRMVLLTAQFFAALGPVSAAMATEAYKREEGRLQEAAKEFDGATLRHVAGPETVISAQPSLAV
jgi:putative DNA methylase